MNFGSPVLVPLDTSLYFLCRGFIVYAADLIALTS